MTRTPEKPPISRALNLLFSAARTQASGLRSLPFQVCYEEGTLRAGESKGFPLRLCPGRKGTLWSAIRCGSHEPLRRARISYALVQTQRQARVPRSPSLPSPRKITSLLRPQLRPAWTLQLKMKQLLFNSN